jgi:hypothetical protein
MKFLCPALLALLIIASRAASQAVFDVIALEGSAKVQRMNQKEWEKLSTGSQLHDNDIVETFFQAKLVLQFGKGNVAILGSNSKALLNIREQKSEKGTTTFEVNLTLFSGGSFVKAIEDCHISVYTSNAVGETDRGGFSTVVESKSGETGFQVLGGEVKARNIAQKEGIRMSSGQTTIIFPGKEPTAPLYITVRHVAVLKHFFGDEYIEMELSAAGIKPTDERATAAAAPPSQDLQAEKYARSRDQGMYKSTFSLNKIYGAILTDQERHKLSSTEITRPCLYLENRIMVEENNSFSSSHGASFPCFSLAVSYSTGKLSAGIRLPMTANFTGKLSLYTSTTAGLLDKIDHLTVGRVQDSIFLNFGPIENYTIGNGVVVSGFNNADPYIIYRPLGLKAQFRWKDFSVHGFVADVSSFSIGGVHLAWEPGTTRFGAGYFFDGNQVKPPADSSVYRFVNLPKPGSATVSLDSSVQNAKIYELDVATDIVSEYSLKISVGIDFAQKLAGSRTDGFVVKAPVVSVIMPTMNFKASVLTESGRLIGGQFHSFYMSNRYRLIDTMSAHDTLFTQNTMLSTKRKTTKLDLSFGMSPYKGVSLSASFYPDVYEKRTLASDTSHENLETGFGLSCSINDSLFKNIKYGTVFVRATHIGLFPPTPSFPSWGFAVGADVISNPLVMGVGFSGGFSLYYLDMNSNDIIDPTDNVVEFRVGLRRGF